MAPKLRIASAALLAAFSLPALALQLGQIEVKSALDQPLVAAVPLHPRNAAELDGLSVALASPADFARAGLKLTPTDRTLRFHVTSNNNGQKLILITSSQPVTDPYLDFLVQLNTRDSKQVHEFVVLLNPVVAAPAPMVRAAPVPAVPAATQLPAASAFPQPPVSAAATPSVPVQAAPASAPTVSQASPVPTPAPATGATMSVHAGEQITVHTGDTLFSIAREAVAGSDISISQMMLALQAANPDAFFRPNINDLKAGAILRVPGRTSAEQRSVAVAAADVLRQNQAWSSAKVHPAALLAGAAATATRQVASGAARAPLASDHLTLAPPTHGTGGATNRPGVAGGTGSAGVAELRQELQADQGTLVSLKQANADLESRVRSLEDISAKTNKLLSLKDSTIAELQRKLASVPPSKSAAGSVAKHTEAAAARARHAPAKARPVAHAKPWYMRPPAWIIAFLVLLGVIAAGVFGRGRVRPRAPATGPLDGPDDAEAAAPDEADGERVEPTLDRGDTAFEASPDANSDVDVGPLQSPPVEVAEGVAAESAPAAVATPVAAEVGPVVADADAVATPPPDDAAGAAPGLVLPLATEVPDASAATPGDGVSATAPEPAQDAVAAAPESSVPDVSVDAPDTTAPTMSASEPTPQAVEVPTSEHSNLDDPVDTKLDLARAYMDMDDAAGARAMLDEVIEEGSQVQKDVAWRLLSKLEATAGRDGG